MRNLERKREYIIFGCIDLQIEIQPVEFDDMANTAPAESSASIRERVIKARLIQQERFKGEKGIFSNAQMNTRLLRQYAWPDAEGLSKLKDRMERLSMSARSFDRILCVARTIADLESALTLPAHDSPDYPAILTDAVNAPVLSRHIGEAIGYRNLDRSDYGQVFFIRKYKYSLTLSNLQISKPFSGIVIIS